MVSPMTTPTEMFNSGKLAEAIAAITAQVKAKPGDASSRSMLAQMVAIAGDFERADRQLDVALQLDGTMAMPLTLMRHLLRAEMTRQRIFSDGPLPQFYSGEGLDESKLRLEAIICLRTGKPADAKTLVDQADAVRAEVRGSAAGKEFPDFRDLDDCFAAAMEVLTANGSYYWIPWQVIESVQFRAPRLPCDLLWRSAAVSLKDGTDAEVYVPAIYVPPIADVDESARLGRRTDWHETGGVIRGIGQRMLLIGSDSVPLMEVESLTFA